MPLAWLGYDVTGIDVSAPALGHARALARATPVLGKARFVKGDLRDVPLPDNAFDAAILVYFVLEAFSRAEQPKVLARLAEMHRAELRSLEGAFNVPQIDL